MSPIEEQILEVMKQNKYIGRELGVLHLLPLGTFSQEFYDDSSIKQYCEKSGRDAKDLHFRCALERYVASANAQQDLKSVEEAIRRLFKDQGKQDKAAGTYVLPISAELIKQIYLLENMPLIDLLQHYAPQPPVRFFVNEQRVPAVIQKREAEIVETMKRFASEELETLEPVIIRAQRRMRMEKRHQEEVSRIAQKEKLRQMTDIELDELEESGQTPMQMQTWAEDLMQDANTPYKPKCGSKLSARIMAAARKVAAFSTVKHITSAKVLQSICDDGLYGQRTLIDLYLASKPATLHGCDVANGDGNVVCLGPQDITGSVTGDIVIEFNLDALIKTKPSAFYKQRDLEYQTNRKIREVKLGNHTLYFDHTGSVRCPESGSTYLQIFTPSGGLSKLASAPKSSFIAYNLEQMHEILTLNFFRFLDRMTETDWQSARGYRDGIYFKLSQLPEEELVRFLTDIEKNLTDTAEFNFYGAHRVDFSTVNSISSITSWSRTKKYTLVLSEFIVALDSGTIEELRRAREKLPALFQSYRFVDYLLSKIKHTEARYYLDNLRKQCKAPEWVQYTPLSVPDEFSFYWEVSVPPVVLEEVVDVAEDKSPPDESQTVLGVAEEKIGSDAGTTLQGGEPANQDSEEHGIEPASDMVLSSLGTSMPEDLPSQVVVDDASNLSAVQDPKITSDEQKNDSGLIKAFQEHQDQFQVLLDGLEAFAPYCSHAENSRVFIQELQKDFATAGQSFFSQSSLDDKKGLASSFATFKSECELLCQKAEKHFEHNTGLWSYIKPILTGFLGVVVALAATVLTAGIATYYVAKNERLRDKYADVFFRVEPEATRQMKTQWTNYGVKQRLFGNGVPEEKGFVNEVEETVQHAASI